MFEAGSSFSFPAKALQMRFGRPRSQTNHFECDGAIETFLSRPINNTLTASTNFLQQLVVAEFLGFGSALMRASASSSRSGATAALKRHRLQSPCGASAKSLLPHLPQTRVTLVVCSTHSANFPQIRRMESPNSGSSASGFMLRHEVCVNSCPFVVSTFAIQR